MDIANFQSIIEEYEKLVKDLTEDLQAVKSEQENLKSKINELISENDKLSREKNEILQKFQKNIGETFTSEQNLIIENLKQQLQSTLSEKEYTIKLWKNAVTSTDRLENELRIYQSGTQGFIPKKDVIKLKSSYESKLQSLEDRLNNTQKELDNLSKHTSNKMEAKQSELGKSLETQTGALNIIKNLEEEILNLQKRLQVCLEQRLKMEKQMKKLEIIVEEMKQKNVQYRTKVTEAVAVVEAALNEKDAALFREKELEDEVQKLSQTLTDILKETEDKVKREVINLTNDFKHKEKNLLQDLSNAQLQIKEKVLEIEKCTQKCIILENETQRLQRGNINIDESNISKLLLLEKNLEATFQKLLLSEKHNIQLSSERNSIKNDLDQMAGLYERNMKEKEIEFATLNIKINNLQNKVNDDNKQIDKLLQELDICNQKIQEKEGQYIKEKESYERLVSASSSEKIAEVTKKYNETLKELKTQLDLKNEMNKKLIKESQTVTDNLEKLIKDSRIEIHRLKQENISLQEKVQKTNEKIKQYKNFLEMISQDVNKLTSITVNKSTIS